MLDQQAELQGIVPEIANLSAREKEALQMFTLVWTVFEAKLLSSSGKTSKIVSVVNPLGAEIFDECWFNEQLDYFQHRYAPDGVTNDRFEYLYLRKNDEPELVRAVMCGENLDVKAQLIACLIVVYRFRNNFFHGVKWADGLHSQCDNFTHSTNLMLLCLRKLST